MAFSGHEAHNGIIHELVSNGMDYIYSVNGTLEKEISAFPQYKTFVHLIQSQYGSVMDHSSAFPMTILVPTSSVLDAALESSTPEEVAKRLLTNHFIPKTFYATGMDFVGEFVTLGVKKLTLAQGANGKCHFDLICT